MSHYKKLTLAGLCFTLVLCLSNDSILDAQSTCAKLTYPDQIGNTRSCAFSLNDQPNNSFYEPINRVHDVDWYYYQSNHGPHPTSSYTIKASTSTINLQVYVDNIIHPFKSCNALPGEHCKLIFATTGGHRYYARIAVSGPFLPGTSTTDVEIHFQL